MITPLLSKHKIKKMRKLAFLFLTVTIFCFGCKEKSMNEVNYQFWKDFHPGEYKAKSFRLINLDLTLNHLRYKIPLDSNFINNNIQIIDRTLGNELIEFKPLYTYSFYLIDTLKKSNEGNY